MLLDPQAAVAAAICHISRTVSPVNVTQRHPGRCGWCDWPVDELARIVRDFDVTTSAVASFRRLPREVQARLVSEAQAVEDAA